MSSFGLDRVFAPRNLALVGGSPRPSSLGAKILRNLTDAGFADKIVVVNPKCRAVDGFDTYPNFTSLPLALDLIVVTAPASTIPDIIADAGRLGVSGAVLGHGEGSFGEAVKQTARTKGPDYRAELSRDHVPGVRPQCQLCRASTRQWSTGFDLAVRRDCRRNGRMGCSKEDRIFGDRLDRRSA